MQSEIDRYGKIVWWLLAIAMMVFWLVAIVTSGAIQAVSAVTASIICAGFIVYYLYLDHSIVRALRFGIPAIVAWVLSPFGAIPELVVWAISIRILFGFMDSANKRILRGIASDNRKTIRGFVGRDVVRPSDEPPAA